MSMLIVEKGTSFIFDPYVNPEPTAEKIAQIIALATETVRRFGIELKAALLSHSNFGSSSSLRALKIREAANNSYNFLRVLSNGVSMGPMLLGFKKTAHILQDSVTTGGILNMTAIVVEDA